MMVCILLPSLLGLVLVSFGAKYFAENAMREQIDSQLRMMAQVQARELDNMMTLLRGANINFSEVARVKRYLAAVKAGNTADAEKLKPAAVDSTREVRTNFAGVSCVGLVDMQGKIITATTEGMIGMEVAQRDYFKKALEGKTSLEAVKQKGTGKMMALLSSPVTMNKDVVGVALVMVDLEKLAASTTNKVTFGKSGNCFVYNAKGIQLMHRDVKYMGDDDSKLEWVRTMLSQKKGMLHYEWDGKAKLAYFDEVPSSGWIVAVVAEENDLLSGINAMVRNLLFIVLGSALVVGLIIFFISLNIARVLRAAAAFAQYVAAGNLTITPEHQASISAAVQRGDEVADMVGSVETMTRNLAEMVGKAEAKTQEAEQAVREAEEAKRHAEAATERANAARREGMLAAADHLEQVVEIITSASTELSAQVEHSERGAAEQAARVSETAAAVEEMNSTVLEVAKNAGTAAEISASTRAKADTGSGVVQEVVQAIGHVAQSANALKDDMGTLSDHARAISQIMSIISDIADQTNLLALNAAIEAARAGEAGRGFAVVADEVRKLAEKTMASTTDVGNAIKAIQESAETSMKHVTATVDIVAKATGLAGQCGAALHEIVNMADTTADQVRAIATASEQQSASSEEITRSITQVSSIAEETTRAMQEAATAVTELARQSQLLTGMITDMKKA